MARKQQSSISLKILDSALILALISAVCYMMGHAAHLGMSRRLKVPLHLMPSVAPETYILVGGLYLVFVGAIVLLIYFLWFLLCKHVRSVRTRFAPELMGIRARAKKYPKIYFLLACLAGATVFYSFPLMLPFTPQEAGGPAAFGGRTGADVIELKLKEPDAAICNRDYRYLWDLTDIVVLQDKKNRDFVLIRKDEIRIMVLKWSSDFISKSKNKISQASSAKPK